MKQFGGSRRNGSGVEPVPIPTKVRSLPVAARWWWDRLLDHQLARRVAKDQRRLDRRQYANYGESEFR